MLGEAVRAAVPIGLVTSQMRWFRNIQELVPQPYLDEVFHVPQAQSFWRGNWTHWDDKITTPPGLYLYSILVNKIHKFDSDSPELTTYDLRWTNMLLLYFMLLALIVLSLLTSKDAPRARFLRREYCIVSFPLFFFFSGLYYTDLFSALTVICTYVFWQAGAQVEGYSKFIFQILHLISGLLSLSSRQTNIFWVAVYFGGLQAVSTIKEATRIHDPPIADAYFEDFPTTAISLVASALNTIPRLVLDLWPHIFLLGSFAAFVFWNGGVVLGDKTNHVATIHLAQMLYIWPFIIFFSWPAVLPHLANPKLLMQRLPRLWVAVATLLPMLAIVHYNTIIHKFLLADNRHYAFYAFKILRCASWTWYALVPVYAVCAWLAIQAFGSRSSFTDGRDVTSSRGQKLSTSSGGRDSAVSDGDVNRISSLIIWLVSTTLSLVTAPLVEPRYFIVPWLMWRLHVPDVAEVIREGHETASKGKSNVAQVEKVLLALAKESLWIEFAWYILINFVTCRLFLFNGFAWPQEPGLVQRFMW